jgi:hypothetical protein
MGQNIFSFKGRISDRFLVKKDYVLKIYIGQSKKTGILLWHAHFVLENSMMHRLLIS